MSMYVFQTLVFSYRDTSDHFQVLEVANMKHLHLLHITFHFQLAASVLQANFRHVAIRGQYDHSWDTLFRCHHMISKSHAEMHLVRNIFSHLGSFHTLWIFVTKHCKNPSDKAFVSINPHTELKRPGTFIMRNQWVDLNSTISFLPIF